MKRRLLAKVNNYVQDREELNLIHPAKKLLLSLPGCVCLRESRWPSNAVSSSSPAGPDPHPRLHHCYCQPFYPHRFYRACVQRTSACSLLTGALLEATAALGSRSSLPCPLPQIPNCHAVLKANQVVALLLSW
ncbi:hypothetical protein NQZ68_035213 [Dissostichus eleginoides]|nr:hypothetical protein NQZ68_035213 [Dissostichus eleginoides]